jgi:hypothetical protein
VSLSRDGTGIADRPRLPGGTRKFIWQARFRRGGGTSREQVDGRSSPTASDWPILGSFVRQFGHGPTW